MNPSKHNTLENNIRLFARQSPQKVAIQGERDDCGIDRHLTYQQLLIEVDRLSSSLNLSEKEAKSFAIIMDNHPAWAVLDLALMFNKQCSIPLPLFFSSEQIKHALSDAGVNFLILENVMDFLQQADFRQLLEEHFSDPIELNIANKQFYCYKSKAQYSVHNKAHKNIQKITYTSGTTAAPKGVMLSESSILEKIQVLAEACGANEDDIALSILPLSTLLENFAGFYVPLYCGAQITLLSAKEIGLSGSSQINSRQLMSTIEKVQPTVFIIIPQLLLLLINLVKSGFQLPACTRFIAMGGAPVSKNLLLLAQQLNIPVFEGYGLSEAASVVSVNTLLSNQIGSVGKVLSSHQIKISHEGEILLKNNLFHGYLNEEINNPGAYYATGDIGHIDDEAYLFITGRIQNVINTSYGRNISPEWIEKELEAITFISQALIYGHGKPFLVALIVLREIAGMNHDQISEQLNDSLENLNSKLPDYARIAHHIIVETPFTVKNQQLTGTGRPRRKVIYKIYENNLNLLYHQFGEYV